jgi:hypothetical protein
MSEENCNINNPMLFYENGKISIVAPIYSSASAKYYEHILIVD